MRRSKKSFIGDLMEGFSEGFIPIYQAQLDKAERDEQRKYQRGRDEVADKRAAQAHSLNAQSTLSNLIGVAAGRLDRGDGTVADAQREAASIASAVGPEIATEDQILEQLISGLKGQSQRISDMIEDFGGIESTPFIPEPSVIKEFEDRGMPELVGGAVELSPQMVDQILQPSAQRPRPVQRRGDGARTIVDIDNNQGWAGQAADLERAPIPESRAALIDRGGEDQWESVLGSTPEQTGGPLLVDPNEDGSNQWDSNAIQNLVARLQPPARTELSPLTQKAIVSTPDRPHPWEEVQTRARNIRDAQAQAQVDAAEKAPKYEDKEFVSDQGGRWVRTSKRTGDALEIEWTPVNEQAKSEKAQLGEDQEPQNLTEVSQAHMLERMAVSGGDDWAAVLNLLTPEQQAAIAARLGGLPLGMNPGSNRELPPDTSSTPRFFLDGNPALKGR